MHIATQFRHLNDQGLNIHAMQLLNVMKQNSNSIIFSLCWTSPGTIIISPWNTCMQQIEFQI